MTDVAVAAVTVDDSPAEATAAEADRAHRRINWKTVLIVVAAFFAIHLLLPQIDELKKSLRELVNANWAWTGLGILAAAGTYAAAATAQMGAVRHQLAFGRTMLVQLAASFIGIFAPASLGGMGLNVKYLTRQGMSNTDAAAGVGLDTFAGFLMHVSLLVIVLPFAGSSSEFHHMHFPAGWIVLVAVVAALAVAGAVFWSPARRRKLLDPVRDAARSMGQALRDPRRAAMLFGGSLGLTVCNILALAVSLQAVGAHGSLLVVAAVYLGGSAVAAAAPTPGGMGAVEAALTAGLTAFGFAAAPAAAGVLLFRLLTFWIPMLLGWPAYQVARARHVV